MITEKARPYYANLLDDMLVFYIQEGQFLSDTRLFREVCVRFGDRMLAEVCPYLDLQIGECAIGAIEIMREAAGRCVQGMKDALTDAKPCDGSCGRGTPIQEASAKTPDNK